VTWAKSAYDSARGKQPAADFRPGPYGPPILCVKNTRTETIIVEDVRADPPLLGFAAGDETQDWVEAIVGKRGLGRERVFFALKPDEEMPLRFVRLASRPGICPSSKAADAFRR